jgi:hypothetical protein
VTVTQWQCGSGSDAVAVCGSVAQRRLRKKGVCRVPLGHQLGLGCGDHRPGVGVKVKGQPGGVAVAVVAVGVCGSGWVAVAVVAGWQWQRQLWQY